jgi:endo-1,4-beta-xylanase
LDLSILPSPYDGASITNVSEYRADYDPYKDGVTSEALEKQAQRMRVFFELFDKVRDSMERVTFWGVGDASSWRNWHPMRGRTDYALLFDRHLKKKPVYNVVKEMGYKSQGVSR